MYTTSPGVAGMAVDDALQIDPPDALQRADEEGIDCNQSTRVRGFDVPFPKLRREPLQQPGLLFRKLHLALGGLLFQPQQALVLS